MSYIGTQQGTAAPVLLDSISVVNGQAAYTMQKDGANYTPASTLVMQTSLNGIIQAPNTSYTIDGSTITFASNLVTGDVIDYILVREPTTGTISAPTSGSVTNNAIVSMAASKLTGALPAIDGSALTGLSSGGLLKTAISRIDTTASRTGSSLGQLADFGSFTPSQTTSTVYILGNANFGTNASQYFGVCFFINGSAYRGTDNSMLNYYSDYDNNGYDMRNVSIFTSVSNTDGSAITVTVSTRGGGTQYINRTQNVSSTAAGSNPISEIMFLEVSV